MQEAGYYVRAAHRLEVPIFGEGVEAVRVGGLSRDTDWREALSDVDSVIHAAARAHVMHDEAEDPLAEYRRVNVEGTINLARQASTAGVRRFVFISSVKVNGEGTALDRPYTEDDIPAPVDPYGISKHEAEEGLRKVSADTGMEIVIIRPALVYGPGVRGNFLRLLWLADKGWPLPLGSIKNLRSFIGVDNLADLIVRCIEHPRAAGETFLAADGEDVSTPGLIGKISKLTGRSERLIDVPASVLRVLGSISGKRGAVDRLVGSLRVDATKARRMLDWHPPQSLESGLERTVRWYVDSYKRGDNAAPRL